MGGRPRTPTKILDLRGSFKSHPDRRAERANEPQISEPLGDPPSFLTADQLQAWKEIVENDVAGVLTKADRLHVEETAKLVALSRLGKIDSAERRLLMSNLGRIGQNPADRSKVSAPTKKPKSAWSNFGT